MCSFLSMVRLAAAIGGAILASGCGRTLDVVPRNITPVAVSADEYCQAQAHIWYWDERNGPDFWNRSAIEKINKCLADNKAKNLVRVAFDLNRAFAKRLSPPLSMDVFLCSNHVLGKFLVGGLLRPDSSEEEIVSILTVKGGTPAEHFTYRPPPPDSSGGRYRFYMRSPALFVPREIGKPLPEELPVGLEIVEEPEDATFSENSYHLGWYDLTQIKSDLCMRVVRPQMFGFTRTKIGSVSRGSIRATVAESH